MATKKKAQRQNLASLIKGELDLQVTQEIKHLIDAAVRKQFDAQEFVQRLTNTRYFRRKFPGLIEKNGTISNALIGQQGVGVSTGSLSQAIRAYKTAEEQFTDLSTQAGYGKVDKKQLAAAIKAGVSADEFAARLNVVSTLDANPEALAAFEQQAKLQGLKPNKQDAYKAALKVGDKNFMDVYEASQYQLNLGIGAQDAKDLATGKGGAAAGATFANVNEVVAAARQNLQAIQPELASQGINAAKLVKVLSNPTAFAKEMDIIQQSLQTRKTLGQQVPGTYAQKGTGGGLALYGNDGEASYG